MFNKVRCVWSSFQNLDINGLRCSLNVEQIFAWLRFVRNSYTWPIWFRWFSLMSYGPEPKSQLLGPFRESAKLLRRFLCHNRTTTSRRYERMIFCRRFLSAGHSFNWPGDCGIARYQHYRVFHVHVRVELLVYVLLQELKWLGIIIYTWQK